MVDINFRPTSGASRASIRDEELYRSPVTVGAEAIAIKSKNETYMGAGIKGKLLFSNCTNQRIQVEANVKVFENGGYKFGANVGPDFQVHDRMAVGAEAGFDVLGLGKLKNPVKNDKGVITQKYETSETNLYGGAYVKYRPIDAIHLQAGVKGGLVVDDTKQDAFVRKGRIGFEGKVDAYVGNGVKATARYDTFKKEAAVGFTYTF